MKVASEQSWTSNRTPVDEKHMNPNICHDRKLIFVHNPKAAGTSFIKWLGFDGRINHGFPSYNTPHELWNKYTVVVCVRDPIDRAFSLYRFLTHESYQGVLTRVYPDIHSWNPKKLFDIIINEQLVFLAWQYKYAQHFHTNKPPDFVLKVEDLKVRNLARKLQIKKPFPRENTARSKRFVDVSEDIYLGLVDHFKVDYLLFDYKPKPYHSYMDGQLEAA